MEEQTKKYMIVLFEDDAQKLERFIREIMEHPELPYQWLPTLVRAHAALRNKYELKPKYKGWLQAFAVQMFGGK